MMEMETNSTEQPTINLKIVAGEDLFETSIKQSNLLEDLTKNLKNLQEKANDALTKLVNNEKNSSKNGE